MNQRVNAWADLLARILLSHIFIYSGIGKIIGYAGTQAELASNGIFPSLLPLVIITELGGGLLILVGLYTRAAAFFVGGFSALVALFFHLNFFSGGLFSFMKNYAIAGGMLLLVLHGPGRFSLDYRRHRDKTGATAGSRNATETHAR